MIRQGSTHETRNIRLLAEKYQHNSALDAYTNVFCFCSHSSPPTFHRHVLRTRILQLLLGQFSDSTATSLLSIAYLVAYTNPSMRYIRTLFFISFSTFLEILFQRISIFFLQPASNTLRTTRMIARNLLWNYSLFVSSLSSIVSPVNLGTTTLLHVATSIEYLWHKRTRIRIVSTGPLPMSVLSFLYLSLIVFVALPHHAYASSLYFFSSFSRVYQVQR